MGGTNHRDNLVKVTVEQHAALHKQLWEDLGHWQDELAWKALSSLISSQEVMRKAVSMTQKDRLEKGVHRFLDMEWQKEKYHKQDMEKRSEISKKTCEEMVKNGTHPFLGGDIQREAHKRRKETGNYLSGGTAPMFGKKHNKKSKEKMSGPRKPYGPQSEEHKKNRIESYKKAIQKKKEKNV